MRSDMRRIQSIVVTYDDNSTEQWQGNGQIEMIDTVSPGPPPASVSFIRATLSIAPRLEINAAGAFTGRRLT